MRVKVFFLLLIIAQFGYSQSGENELINGSFTNVTLETIFDSLSTQTNYYFSDNSDLLPKGSLYTISGENLPIGQLLSCE